METKDREQWAEVRDHFNRLLDLPPDSRQDEIERLKKEKSRVWKEVMSLLSAHESASSFLERPAAPSRLLVSFAKAPSVVPELRPGEAIGDFLIIRELGRGAFATVYAAVQVSLGREVALKVSRNWGDEAKTMAVLDHDNVVRVFSETVLEDRNLRLICMQLVDGTTLEAALEQKLGHLLQDIDSVLEMGIDLANALHYAHTRNVLHLDVKPGNILFSKNSKALLTDFNVAMTVSVVDDGKVSTLLGGTLKYMSPEQKRMMEEQGAGLACQEKIDCRADVFALGTLLKEVVRTFAITGVSDRIKRSLDKATREKPDERYPTAKAMALCLEAAREHESVNRNLPIAGKILDWTTRYPLVSLTSFIMLPQILGSIINIAYNGLLIVSKMTPEQQALFQKLIGIYNPIIYLPCSLYLWNKLTPIRRFLANPKQFLDTHTESEVDSLRAHTLKVPFYVALITALGWSAGFFLFPMSLHLMVGPLTPEIFFHFFVSFLLSGTLALTYSSLYTELVCLRGIYPQLFIATTPISSRARVELAESAGRMGIEQYLVGFTPLLGAMLILLTGYGKEDPNLTKILNSFLVFLIFLGMIGMVLGLRITRIVEQTRFALVGSETSRPSV